MISLGFPKLLSSFENAGCTTNKHGERRILVRERASLIPDRKTAKFSSHVRHLETRGAHEIITVTTCLFAS